MYVEYIVPDHAMINNCPVVLVVVRCHENGAELTRAVTAEKRAIDITKNQRRLLSELDL